MPIESLVRRPSIWFDALGPVYVAFLGSLLLSFIALQNSAVLNPDGMLYIEVARKFIDQGFTGTSVAFDWLPLPLLIAGLGYVTQLNPELVAHILDALFMAGTCALMVDLIRRRMPEAAWIACLVALSVPAYNGYRDYLIREFGYWFFSVLALWLALRWEDKAFRWREAIAFQIALICAVSFRLEAIVFFPAFLAWQLISAPAGQKTIRAIKVATIPVAAGFLLLALYATDLIKLPPRAIYYLDAANVLGNFKISEQAAKLLASGVFPDYSKEEAGYVLFFGLLSIIPVKLLGKFGIFVIPFSYACLNRPARCILRKWALTGWMFAAHLSALIAFVTYQSFLSGRYVSMLNLLVVPVVAVGMLRLMERYPRWKILFLALVVLTMLANVVSFSPQRTQIPAAGAWLAANHPESSRVFVDNPRIAFYAGWSFAGRPMHPFDSAKLTEALAGDEFDLLVLSQSHKESTISDWVAMHRLQIVQRFTSKTGDTVFVIAPSPDQASRSSTGKSREKTASTE